MTWPTADEIIHLIWPKVEPERMPLYREQADAILARFEPLRADRDNVVRELEQQTAHVVALRADLKLFASQMDRAWATSHAYMEERDAARAALRTAVSLIGMGIAAAEIGVGAQDIARKLREAMAQFTPEVRIALGDAPGEETHG